MFALTFSGTFLSLILVSLITTFLVQALPGASLAPSSNLKYLLFLSYARYSYQSHKSKRVNFTLIYNNSCCLFNGNNDVQ